MYRGILFSIMAGLFIAVQGIFNTRVSDKIGFWEANTFVKGTAFLFALIITLISGKGNFSNITQINKVYLLGGVMGAIIVFGVMKGITYIGATNAVTLIIVSQIICALIINSLGLFGENKLSITPIKVLGLAFMFVGIILFQFKGLSE
ncbi:DMT family transporter [Sporosalibacterium faouarense]|uniref:DMT family transporter n=1 Tax=Sporosalibacterium faouarense TaxID=516123 RepID=UPI00141CAF35|nr:DMT family transporter [Sporosalibacterium faouarense]MTI46392.1 DMT family transporter [Bacillota bacterium]